MVASVRQSRSTQTLETVKPYECMIWDRGRMDK